MVIDAFNSEYWTPMDPNTQHKLQDAIKKLNKSLYFQWDVYFNNLTCMRIT